MTPDPDDTNHELEALKNSSPNSFLEFVAKFESNQSESISEILHRFLWATYWESMGLAANVATAQKPPESRKWNLKNSVKKSTSPEETKAKIYILAERAETAASRLKSSLSFRKLDQASLLAAGALAYSTSLKSNPSQLIKADPYEIKNLQEAASKFTKAYSQKPHKQLVKDI